MESPKPTERNALPTPTGRAGLALLLLLAVGGGALAFQCCGRQWLYGLEQQRNPEFRMGMVFTPADQECTNRLFRRSLAYPFALYTAAAVVAAILLMRFRARWWWVLGNLAVVAVWAVGVWRGIAAIGVFIE